MSKKKKIIKVETIKKDGKMVNQVSIKCEVCGEIYQTSNRNYEAITKTIEGQRCIHCSSRNILSDNINSVLLEIRSSKTNSFYLNKNILYYKNRIKTNNRLDMFKFLNDICTNLNIVNKILSENITLGLKDPFKKSLNINDFILKSKDDDHVDRIRYFYPIEKYETEGIRRGTFKRTIKNHLHRFEDFNEVFLEKKEYFDSKNNRILIKNYYNYFKKGDYIYESYQR